MYAYKYKSDIICSVAYLVLQLFIWCCMLQGLALEERRIRVRHVAVASDVIAKTTVVAVTQLATLSTESAERAL